MTAQKGKDLLLKLDSAGAGNFVTVAGLRSRAIAFNARAVDVPHADSAGRRREPPEGAGVRSAALTGRGIFRDAASDASVREIFFAGAIRDWQVVIPDFGTVAGKFQITALEFSGDHDGEVSFDLALESAGEIGFVAM